MPTHLLGVAGEWLIAGGRKLYWISLKEEDRGRVKHVWPETSDQPPGYGRGVLAGSERPLADPRQALHLRPADRRAAKGRRSPRPRRFGRQPAGRPAGNC